MKCCDDFINAIFADRRCQVVLITSLINGSKQRKRNVTIINYPFNNSPLTQFRGSFTFWAAN